MTNKTKFKYSIGSDVLGMYWYGNLYFGWFDLLRMCWFILPTDICQAMLVMLHDKVRRCVYWKRIYISVYLKPTLSLVLCVCFVDHCLSFCPFVLLYFFSSSLCCLFFFDLRILITPLVSSNSSYLLPLNFRPWAFPFT